MKKNIVIATVKSWNIANARVLRDRYQDLYEIFVVDKKENLTFEFLDKIKPDFVFFPHWSWIIPEKIFNNFLCIVFHMTDLPYGRGGSPLQNLIVNKKYDTKISAIQVAEGLDTGKVYLKEPFYVGIGSAEEILQQVSEKIFSSLIPKMLTENLVPYEQQGEIVSFKRRRPEESNLLTAQLESLIDYYDFIRMLDAEGYPNAFIKNGNFKITFTRVTRKNNKLEGTFEINSDQEL